MNKKITVLILICIISIFKIQAEDVEPVVYQPLPTQYNVAIGVATSIAEKPMGQPLGFIQNRIMQNKPFHKALDKQGNRIPLLFQGARYYRGLPTSVACGGISTGIEVVAKEKYTGWLNPHNKELTSYQRLLAGTLAGSTSALIDPVVETIILEQQNKNKNLPRTINNIWNIRPSNTECTAVAKKEEIVPPQKTLQGIKNFYRGFGSILTRNSLTACGNWAAFEELRNFFKNYIADTTINNAVAATITGLGTATFTHPFTFAKTRLQADIARAKYSNTIDVWKKAIDNEGFFSIFKGYTPRTIRAILASAVMFNTQDVLKHNARQNYNKPKSSASSSTQAQEKKITTNEIKNAG